MKQTVVINYTNYIANEETLEKEFKKDEIILNSGNIDQDDGINTILRRPKGSTPTLNEQKWGEFQVQSNPVVDEQVSLFKSVFCLTIRITQESFQNLGLNENSRELFNPYGDEDHSSYNQNPVWETEIRSPADGNFTSSCPERKSGDGLETPDDIEPRKNYFDSESEDDSGNEQYQVKDDKLF